MGDGAMTRSAEKNMQSRWLRLEEEKGETNLRDGTAGLLACVNLEKKNACRWAMQEHA